MSLGLSLVVNPETMADINRRGLKIPKDANAKGTCPPGVVPGSPQDPTSYKWAELLQITDASVSLDEKVPEQLNYMVKFRVPDDTPFPTNIGENGVILWRIHRAALVDSGHALHGRTSFNFRDLMAFLRACGIDTSPGVDYSVAFVKPDGGTSAPLVGFKVFCTVTDKPGETQDGEPTRFQNYGRFLPESAGQ